MGIMLTKCIFALGLLLVAVQGRTIRQGYNGRSLKTGVLRRIVVVHGEAFLKRLDTMCEGIDKDSSCNMKGVCGRFFRSSLTGLVGAFGDDHINTIHRCIPGGVKYVEDDGEVFKAEGMHSDSDYSNWWDVPEPKVHGMGGPQVTVDGGANSSFSTEEQRYLLATIGLQTQKALTEAYKKWRESLQVEAFAPDTPTVATGETPADLRVKAESGSADLPLTVVSADDAFKAGGPQVVLSPGVKNQPLQPALWNLDRMDQRDLPLDKDYRYGTPTSPGTGRGVTIYTVDSGVKMNHQEFSSWDGSGSRASFGFDFVENDNIPDDCDGHGTHVASTAVGRYVGVAKDAKVVAVRVLDCEGSGSISNTAAGIEWVCANHNPANGPAIITLSLGVATGAWSRSLEDQVRNAINKHNITVVVASGNSGIDSCTVTPASVEEAITVAGSNLATKFTLNRPGDAEEIYRWSNTGKCVDIFAPGVDIFAACGGATRCQAVTPSAYTWASGTSMAVPHVAGVAAVYLSDHPTATPAMVKEALLSVASLNVLQTTNMKPGTPNVLLYSNLYEQPVQAASSRVVPAAGTTGR